MTTPTRLERTLPRILDELSVGPTPEYLDDVFVRTGRMRQRPAWTFPERWLPMANITRSRAFAPTPPWRLIALALVVIALVVGALLYAGSRQQRVPPPFGPARNGLIPYDAGGDIYVGDPVTGGSRLVVGGPETDSAPGFSPDGTLVAFLRLDSANCCMSSHIVVVRPDGSDLKRVTTASIPSDAVVQWAPDSRHLAIIETVDGHDRLDVLDLDGHIQRLTGDMDISSFAFRPPLAQEILVRAVVEGHPGLFAMNADGTNVRQLIASTKPADATFEYANATYSADGKQIFYQSWTPPGIQPEGCCQLWVMDADGSNPRQFVRDGVNLWEGVAAASPDGQWIAFWRVDTNGSVAVVRTDGTGPVIKTGPTLTGTASWVWAPDSSKILMVPSDAADNPRHYLLDPAGGQWKTTKWQSPTSPDWQRTAQ